MAPSVTPLLQNVLQQPSALECVRRYHTGEGRDALRAAAELLSEKRRIVITGMGASLFAGIGFAYALASSGLRAQAIEASELLYFLDRELDAETAVVLVSRSGESIEITRLLKKCRGRGALSVGVANVPESILAKEAERPVLIASPPDQFAAIQTYTGTVATFALLHAEMREELSTAAQELEETAKVLSQWVPKCVDARDQWDGFLDSTGPYYLLGRGPTLGSAAEGVLLMHEIAKSPAVGMSAAQFRHGPVEVVNTAFHAIVLGSQPQTAELDAALANDLIAMGGTVRWLGPVIPNCAAPPLCDWPAGVPPRFWSLMETVPLQCLAYRKAERMGIPPGEFRWAPQVTTAESGFPHHSQSRDGPSRPQ